MPGCCSPHLYGKKSHDDDIGITQTPGGEQPPPRCHTAVIFLRLSGRSNTSMGKTPVSRIRPKKMWLASWTPESSEISSSRPFWWLTWHQTCHPQGPAKLLAVVKDQLESSWHPDLSRISFASTLTSRSWANQKHNKLDVLTHVHQWNVKPRPTEVENEPIWIELRLFIQ